MVNTSGVVSDTDMMYRWMYSDTIHADQLDDAMTSAGIEERFRAACGIIARICGRVEMTLAAIEVLIEAGALEIDTSALTDVMLVTKTTYVREANIYAADPTSVDPPRPNDLSPLDASIWRPVDSDFARGLLDTRD